MSPRGSGFPSESRELASIGEFLEREHAAQSESRESLYDRPVEERVASGTAIAEVYYSGMQQGAGEKLLVFTAAKNDSRFRPGTRLRLSRGDPRSAAGLLELVDDRHDGGKYVLRLAGSLEDPRALESPEPWVLDEDVFDLLGHQLHILQKAEEEGLGGWLEGSEEYRDPEPDDRGSPFAEGLDGSMRTAFGKALAAEPYFAVQGPPGSGKTHLLARLALHYALEEGARVLITAVSHQAIHNALGETYWSGGKAAKDHPRADELFADGFVKLGASRGKNEGLPDGIRPAFRVPRRKRSLIAGATLYAAMRPGTGAQEGLFDVILFDEAGQAPLVLALAARLLAPKVVFIGDDAQLPPVVQTPPDEDAGPLPRMSALEFIRRTYAAPFLLEESRRLNAELCAVISDCFYGGALRSSEEAAGRTLRLGLEPSAGFREILRPDRSLVFLDVPHKNAKSSSEAEARWAAAVAAEAVRCGLLPDDIGVVAPYRSQCNRIRFLLGRRGPLASTVDRFQGTEREMIIVSLTSSHPRYLARLAAFLFDPHRLNVAVSRARTKVVLIGSRGALSAAVESAGPDSDELPGFEAFRRMLAAAHAADGSRAPAPAAQASAVCESPPSSLAFEPGVLVRHAKYGTGRVLARTVQTMGRRREWVNEIRFQDGRVRLVVPRLSDPPMKAVG